MPDHPHRERGVQRAYEDMVEKLSLCFVNKGRDNLWASGSSATLARAPVVGLNGFAEGERGIAGSAS